MSNEFHGSLHTLLREAFGENYKATLSRLDPVVITGNLKYHSMRKGCSLTTVQVRAIYKLREKFIKDECCK